MKLSKLLITTTLGGIALTAPLGIMTSCSQTWGNKTPIAIGSNDINSEDNPYIKFKDADLYDLDGLRIGQYMQSNYIIDVAKSATYAYTTPVSSFYDSTAKVKKPIANWTDGNSAWYSSAPGFKLIESNETCYKNVSLAANISFTTTIGQFINKYLTYALSYQLSQIPSISDFDNSSFDAAWGGKAPVKVEKNKTDATFMEWLFANSNSHATSAVEAMMKTTTTNFNYIDMPIPSYKADHTLSDATKLLLFGYNDDKTGPAAFPGKHYTAVSEKKDGKQTFTYDAVPVVIRTRNLSQRYINPKINNTYHISEYYNYKKNKNESAKIDKDLVRNKVGDAWKGMSNYVASGTSTKPEHMGFKLSTPTAGLKFGEGRILDTRLAEKDVRGTDFIAFVKYEYVRNDDNTKDTVTLSQLQTVMPAYMFAFQNDLYKVANNDYNAKIVDTTKADKYSNTLFQLLSRASKQGKIAQAKDVNAESKQYLQFLKFMFAKEDGTFADWLSTINF